MINLKNAFYNKSPSVLKNKNTQRSAKKNVRSNIHKCPVNTLLTSIFSGIAWNG